MHEDIFAGLALDEPVTLRSIEPLHCALFLHLHYLIIRIALPLLVQGLATREANYAHAAKRRDCLQPAKNARPGSLSFPILSNPGLPALPRGSVLARKRKCRYVGVGNFQFLDGVSRHDSHKAVREGISHDTVEDVTLDF